MSPNAYPYHDTCILLLGDQSPLCDCIGILHPLCTSISWGPLCYHAMAERLQCPHCAELNQVICNHEQSKEPSLNTSEHIDGNESPLFVGGETTGYRHSGQTPDGHQNGSAETSNGHLEKNGESEKDEEKGSEQGPPHAVGVFHSSLNKLRLEVFGLWARTGRVSFQ